MSFNERRARRRAKAVELYLAGEPPGRIGAAVGYSEQYVRVILRQCGAMPVGATDEATPVKSRRRATNWSKGK